MATPMPRSRSAPMQDEDLAKLHQAARSQFAEFGFHDASLNRILEAAGVSKGSFYYHYENKHDLFEATVLATVVPVVSSVPLPGPAPTPDEFWADVYRYCEDLANEFLSAPDAMPLLRAAASMMTDPKWADTYQEMRQTALNSMSAAIEAGQSSGAVRADLRIDLLASVLLAIDEQLDRWVLLGSDGDNPQELDAWTALAVDLMRRVCEPRAVAV